MWCGRKYTLFGMRSSDWNIDLDKNVSSVNLFFSAKISLADWLNDLHIIFMEVPIPWLVLYQSLFRIESVERKGLNSSSLIPLTFPVFKDGPQFLDQGAILLTPELLKRQGTPDLTR